MGAGFRWLLASSWATNVGDGIALAAAPLLVALQTHNASLIAMAGVLQRAPWLLPGLYAGAVADRVDRRVLVMVADGTRALVVAVLCLSSSPGASTSRSSSWRCSSSASRRCSPTRRRRPC